MAEDGIVAFDVVSHFEVQSEELISRELSQKVVFDSNFNHLRDGGKKDTSGLSAGAQPGTMNVTERFGE